MDGAGDNESAQEFQSRVVFLPVCGLMVFAASDEELREFNRGVGLVAFRVMPVLLALGTLVSLLW